MTVPWLQPDRNWLVFIRIGVIGLTWAASEENGESGRNTVLTADGNGWPGTL